MKNPEDMTRYELRAEIDATNEVIEHTTTITVAMNAASYLQELYDELTRRPANRSPTPHRKSPYECEGLLERRSTP